MKFNFMYELAQCFGQISKLILANLAPKTCIIFCSRVVVCYQHAVLVINTDLTTAVVRLLHSVLVITVPSFLRIIIVHQGMGERLSTCSPQKY
jgi:hypothetical protein